MFWLTLTLSAGSTQAYLSHLSRASCPGSECHGPDSGSATGRHECSAGPAGLRTTRPRGGDGYEEVSDCILFEGRRLVLIPSSFASKAEWDADDSSNDGTEPGATTAGKQLDGPRVNPSRFLTPFDYDSVRQKIAACLLLIANGCVVTLVVPRPVRLARNRRLLISRHRIKAIFRSTKPWLCRRKIRTWHKHRSRHSNTPNRCSSSK